MRRGAASLIAPPARSGEAVEAAMEEEIAEFEEEGGLAVSIFIWLLALAAPAAVLVVRGAATGRQRRGKRGASAASGN
jgi:hypothetical protein